MRRVARDDPPARTPIREVPRGFGSDPARADPFRPAHRDRAARPPGPRPRRVRRGLDVAEPAPRLPDRAGPRRGPDRRGHRRQPLPRLRGRHRGDLDRPCAPGLVAADPGAGRGAHPLQRLGLLPADLRGGLPRAGPASRPFDAARAGVPRQLRDRGRRGGDQARPPRHRAAVHRRLPGRLPRPDVWRGRRSRRRRRSTTPASGRCCPGVYHAPFGKVEDLRWFDEVLFERLIPADEVAAIVVEPIQGEGGYIVPEDGFLQGLRAICDQHGILLVADEIQSGAGRTGKMWAIEHWGVKPDILLTAKGIACGMPIGALVARADLIEPGAPARTAPRTAATRSPARRPWRRSTLLKDGLVENAAARGEQAMAGLESSPARFPGVIHDVRGKGLMIGVEFDSRERADAVQCGGLPAGPARARVRQVDHPDVPVADRFGRRGGDRAAPLRRGGRRRRRLRSRPGRPVPSDTPPARPSLR